MAVANGFSTIKYSWKYRFKFSNFDWVTNCVHNVRIVETLSKSEFHLVGHNTFNFLEQILFTSSEALVDLLRLFQMDEFYKNTMNFSHLLWEMVFSRSVVANKLRLCEQHLNCGRRTISSSNSSLSEKFICTISTSFSCEFSAIHFEILIHHYMKKV